MLMTKNRIVVAIGIFNLAASRRSNTSKFTIYHMLTVIMILILILILFIAICVNHQHFVIIWIWRAIIVIVIINLDLFNLINDLGNAIIMISKAEIVILIFGIEWVFVDIFTEELCDLGDCVDVVVYL